MLLSLSVIKYMQSIGYEYLNLAATTFAADYHTRLGFTADPTDGRDSLCNHLEMGLCNNGEVAPVG